MKVAILGTCLVAGVTVGLIGGCGGEEPVLSPHPLTDLSLWEIATGEGAEGTVLLPLGAVVPFALREGQGQITLVTPSGGGEYMLILYSLSRKPGTVSFTLQITAAGGKRLRQPGSHLSPLPGQALGGIQKPSLFRGQKFCFHPPPEHSGTARVPFLLPRRTQNLTVPAPCGPDAPATLTVRQVHRGLFHHLLVAENVEPKAFPEEMAVVLGQTFDQQVYPTLTKLLGAPSDLDHNGRVLLVFTPLLNEWGYNGAFCVQDLLFPKTGQPQEVLYFRLPQGPSEVDFLCGMMGHELTHLIHVTQRLRRGLAAEELWLMEGLAAVGQDLAGFPHSNMTRVKAYLQAPPRFSILNLDLSEGGRGGLYLFLRYLVDRFGTRLLARLVRGENTGVWNVEAATGMPFADLFRDWAAAVYLTNLPITTQPPYQFTSSPAGTEKAGEAPWPAETILALSALPFCGQVARGGVHYLRVVVPSSNGVTLTLETAADSGLRWAGGRLSGER